MKDDAHVRDFPLFPWECLRDSFHWTVHAVFFILSCCTVCAETCLCRGQALSGWITVKVLEKKAGGKKKKNLALYEVGFFLLTGLLVHKINFISILSPMQWINFAKSFWKTDRGKASNFYAVCFRTNGIKRIVGPCGDMVMYTWPWAALLQLSGLENVTWGE